ncbi:MAG TPA: membrane protein insertion efficiency factor YidD [Nitrospiraceae bacterium]|nr:membrane protein insertion efficiency factor YidD [Nitrospiraceae bacterium]
MCLWLIAAYRVCVSPYLGPTCRFHPSCSAYARDAITRFGVVRGIWMAGIRLSKCHPFHPGGLDPVK